LSRPSRGQQPAPSQESQPTVRFSVPATANRRAATTRVEYELTLPAGVTLPRHPRVRVLNANGEIRELRSMSITRRRPTWTGYRDLETQWYRPGTYSVSVEVRYQKADGQPGVFNTPASTLTVPAR
jgi:hypothetical protein